MMETAKYSKVIQGGGSREDFKDPEYLCQENAEVLARRAIDILTHVKLIYSQGNRFQKYG